MNKTLAVNTKITTPTYKVPLLDQFKCYIIYLYRKRKIKFVNEISQLVI